jgi:hypothetical protein
MRIGFDFDNTIVSYDKLFHTVAGEKGLIPSALPISKQAVRDHLRKMNQEPIWTEMQGYVYGARLKEAEAFPDVLHVIQKLHDAGHTLAVISHKTKYPYLGVPYDLHQAAREWAACHLPHISNQHLFFELTKSEKIARIRDFECDIFIDDLPEILLDDHFPKKIKRFLFDPAGHHIHSELNDLHRVKTWNEFLSFIF